MTNTSDIIFDYLYKKGVRHIFTLSGGGNIHLVDALGRSRIQYVCNHHEQAAATAAEGYARLRGMGVSLVTTGPGGTNAITGVAGAWLDSIPTMTISGQVRTDIMGTPYGMRQLGPQEINIIDMVRPITKYAVTVTDSTDIVYHLEKAWYLATSGRPGPVWLDIPLDIQGASVKSERLRHFFPDEFSLQHQAGAEQLDALAGKILDKLQRSRRPVLYVGNGIRLADAHSELMQLIDILKIPVLTSYVGYDMVPSSHPYFFGRAHSFGQRAANFILQNSDFFLAIGARLDILATGFTYKAFARGAYKIMVDIDQKELEKKTLSIDLPVQCDAKLFIGAMLRKARKASPQIHISSWLTYGRRLNRKYSGVPAGVEKEKEYVNSYHFIDVIGRKYLKPKEIIVESDGVGPLNCMYQAFYVKSGQRIILNLGCAQMGYGLPAAIGVAFAVNKKRRIICFEGDGSIQLNIHELQVIKHHNLPLKIFVYSNDGYLSIRNTQKGLFGGRIVASDAKSGVSCPDIVKVAKAYGIRAIRIHSHLDMEKKIQYALKYAGPILVDIVAKRDLVLTPKVTAIKTADGHFISSALEDMAPFLTEEEMRENMIIPLWQRAS
ncbi:thiamine pyrophosphate-binding protein [Candidatus Gottesmanbacteria bacterium]|nr:thiamine pyrophosphate-binding protein [Candidatus Gottesmanbacteria bacterium]